MTLRIVALVTMVLASGCASNPQSGSAKSTDTATPDRRPSRPDVGLVMGRTMCITFGLPGALAGKPGKPIPRRAVPEVEVHFKGDSGDYTVTSGADGTYSIELPPGQYRIGWLHSWEREREADPFESSEHLGPEVREITVEAGKIYELELPVISMFVD